MRSRSVLLFLPLLLSGCALSSTAPPTPQQGVSFSGVMHGGQQPIVGGKTYLLAVNTTGYGGNGIAASSSNASVSLLNSAELAVNNGAQGTGWGTDGNGNSYVITDSNGNFTISNDYSCTAGQQLYLYGVGGNPGAGTNTDSGLLAALGDCANISQSTFVWMNEVSTIATAYALAGFATDATHISTSGTTLAKQGIANAFLSVTNMETLGTGAALATTPTANGGNGTVPQNEIYYLANILAACINSTSGSSSTQCTTLLNTATSTGSTSCTSPCVKATDTATAAIYIAQNPGQNVSTLYGIAQGVGAAFTSTLSQPRDWTISILYTGGGLTTSTGQVGVDGAGNVWVVNGSSLSEFNTTGKAATGSPFTGSGTNVMDWLAIDSSNNVFVTNQGNNTVSEFNSSGTEVGGTPALTGGGLAQPTPVALDKLGNVWVGNQGGTPNSLSKFTFTTSWNGTNFAASTLSTPSVLAIDKNGNVWAANYGGYGISEYNTTTPGWFPSSTTELQDGGSGCIQGGVQGIAIDGSGNIWATGFSNTGGCLAVYNPTGATWPSGTNGTGYTGGGIDCIAPLYVAIDGAGTAWATTGGKGAIAMSSSGTALSPGASPSNCSGPFFGGYSNSGFASANALAVDGSGNVWVAGKNGGSGALLEFVGAGSPVVTPMVANLISPYGTAAVNKP